MSRTGISEWILKFCSRPSGSCLRAADPSDGMDGRDEVENLMKVVERIKPGTKTADGREVVFAFVGAGSVLQYYQGLRFM